MGFVFMKAYTTVVNRIPSMLGLCTFKSKNYPHNHQDNDGDQKTLPKPLRNIENKIQPSVSNSRNSNASELWSSGEGFN